MTRISRADQKFAKISKFTFKIIENDQKLALKSNESEQVRENKNENARGQQDLRLHPHIIDCLCGCILSQVGRLSMFLENYECFMRSHSRDREKLTSFLKSTLHTESVSQLVSQSVDLSQFSKDIYIQLSKFSSLHVSHTLRLIRNSDKKSTFSSIFMLFQVFKCTQ